MTAIEKIRAEIKERISLEKDLLKRAGDSYRIEGSIDALKGLLSFLDTIEEKKIEPLEMPYQDADSGLVLDIPQLVDKINEIIRYINQREEEYDF